MTEPPRTPVRDLAIGITVAVGAMGLVFFGSFGHVEVATLVMTVVVLIWISTTDPRRLVDESNRPAPMLFGLGLVGLALVFTAAVLISTVTEYVTLSVGVAAYLVGLTRAIRFRLSLPPGEG